MLEIREIDIDQDLKELLTIIQRSFKTVADEMGLTPEVAPTNPAYITEERLIASVGAGTDFSIALFNNQKVGCIALEKDQKKAGNYFIERLAVLPEYRHNKLGETLLDHAIQEIRERGGISAGIAIIDENTRLKNWYLRYGFIEEGTKKFDHLPFTVCFMNLKL